MLTSYYSRFNLKRLICNVQDLNTVQLYCNFAFDCSTETMHLTTLDLLWGLRECFSPKHKSDISIQQDKNRILRQVLYIFKVTLLVGPHI